MKKLMVVLAFALIGLVVFTIGKDGNEKALEKKLRDTSTAFLEEYAEMDIAGMKGFVPANSADWDEKLYELIENYSKFDPVFEYEINYVTLYDGKINPAFVEQTGVTGEIKRVADVCVKIIATAEGQTYDKNAFLYMGLVNGEWKLVYQDDL